MKVLFDSRLYVYDRELRSLANNSSLFIMERPDMNDVGGITNATSVAIKERGHRLERFLSSLGWQITLPTYIGQYSKIVSNIKPDVLVVNDFFRLSAIQALLYKKRNPSLRLILISETRRWPKRFMSRVFMRIMLLMWKYYEELVDKVIVYTDGGSDFFAKHWTSVDISVIPPTIDTLIFRAPFDREFLPKGVLRIVMNARYFSYKRHNILLSALTVLRDEGHDFLLTLISRVEEGKASVVAEITRLNLDNLVVFSPPLVTPELVKLMSEQDVLVLPSHNEAIGMVVPEAMACGVPTITSDTVGANIYVSKGETGLIFQTDSVLQLCDCLRSCYSREYLSQMGQAAAITISQSHSSSLHSNRLNEAILYENRP